MLPPGHNFTERVRKIADIAYTEAARLGQRDVTPLHLAVGLIREGGGVATTALQFHGLSLEHLERELVDLLAESPAVGAPPALTAESLTLLMQAGSEARAMNHPYVGTEHLLLAMLRDPATSVAGILGMGGFGFAEARARVDWILYGDPQNPAPFSMHP